MGNRFLSLVTNVLYRTTLSDMETCYKLIARSVFESLDLRANRFDIEPEITAKILRRRIRIYEVPISYAGREFDEGRRSRGATASRRCGCSSSAASRSCSARSGADGDGRANVGTDERVADRTGTPAPRGAPMSTSSAQGRCCC